MTIYDVAARAGVGIATVSRALRGSAPVAEATRAKVLAAVEELGFRPSHAGTCLLYTSPSPRDGLLSRMPSSA